MDVRALVRESLARLQALNEGHRAAWGLGQARRWDFDQTEGILRFTFDDGKIVEAAAQIVGSHVPATESWLWAWANESIEAPLVEHARLVRTFGEEHGIREFREAKVGCSEKAAWRLAAVALRLADAQGVYRGPAGGTNVFFTFGAPRIVAAGEVADAEGDSDLSLPDEGIADQGVVDRVRALHEALFALDRRYGETPAQERGEAMRTLTERHRALVAEQFTAEVPRPSWAGVFQWPSDFDPAKGPRWSCADLGDGRFRVGCATDSWRRIYVVRRDGESLRIESEEFDF